MDQEADPVEGDAEIETGNHPDPGDKDQSGAEDEDKEQRVPLSRFNQVVAKLADATDRLDQTSRQQQEADRAQPEKTYTAAELNSLVDAEKLSQDDADEIREVQLAKRVTKEVVGAVAQNSQEAQLTADLQQYAAAIPALDDPNSDEYLRVKDELRYLYSVGQPEGVGTMLAATRAIFGSLAALKAPAGAKPKAPDAHPEGGSGGGDDAPDPSKGKKPDMTAKQKEHYRKKIDAGVYADWNEVHEELNYTPGA